MDKDGWSNNYKEKMCKFIQLVVKNNYLRFRDELFHQQRGTVMRSPMASTYVILALGYTEIHIPDKWKNNISEYESISRLKLTLEVKQGGYYNCDFLDVIIRKNKKGNSLQTRIEKRALQLCTHTTFNDNAIQKLMIIRNESLRICKITSDHSLKDIHLDKLTSDFKKRGYPHKILKNKLVRSKCHDQAAKKSQNTKTGTIHSNQAFEVYSLWKPNHNYRPNISKELATGLKRLKNRNNLVIKKADKGGKVVVWSET
ncbi:hypothetical protein GJ496_003472 [Pomphorhynchus laevis]|nr:hypothetical protein GJ496_003472 [Pomphorhynchus laevis]